MDSSPDSSPSPYSSHTALVFVFVYIHGPPQINGLFRGSILTRMILEFIDR